MKIFTTKSELTQYLKTLRENGSSIGFVPTMGALHEGHISLIRLAQQDADVVVCSIFVNPTQFNDPKDLALYPRPISKDMEKLENAACDVLFMPEVEEMYAENEKWHIDLEGLDEVLEGKQRPGHYQGVTQIVNKLFDCVAPNKAYFGQKDFQQFLVIRKMVEKLNLPVQLVMCPIIREEDGLAMSSRNIRLSAQERKNALALNRVLHWMEANFDKLELKDLKEQATDQLKSSPGIELEYLEICDTHNLHSSTNKSTGPLVALVAARLGETRLIDNIILN